MIWMKPAFQSTVARMVGIFGIFLMLGIGMAWQALRWPMVYDDLHLIRPFSGQQLANAFHGNWDPDGIETPGLRPLSTLFYDIRYSLFGENVVAHRLFVVVLYAVYLTLICWIVWKFGLTWRQSLAAGVLCICAKYNIYHYVWLTDGIHLVQGLAFCLSVICLLAVLQKPRWWMFLLSLVALTVGILSREDTLAVVPVILLLGYIYAKHYGDHRQLNYLYAYAATTITLSLAFVAYRKIAFPEAQPIGFDPTGLIFHIIFMFNIMGLKYFDFLTALLISIWAIVPFGILVGYIKFRTAISWRLPALWLACAVLACTPGLTIARTNLLFFPMTFITLFFCSALSVLGRTSRAARLLVGVLFVWGLIGEMYISSLTIESFHPSSALAVKWNSEFIYGSYASKATIPLQRRDEIVKQLAAVGITSADDMSTRFPKMVEQAIAENKRLPTAEGVFFVPYLQGIFEP